MANIFTFSAQLSATREPEISSTTRALWVQMRMVLWGGKKHFGVKCHFDFWYLHLGHSAKILGDLE